MLFDTPSLPFTLDRPPRSDATSGYLLFFTLLPPQALALTASAIAQDWRLRHRLEKEAMPASRLHLTLQSVLDSTSEPDMTPVQGAVDAAAGIVRAMRPVTVRFDRIGSMRELAPTALVLHCDAASRRALSTVRDPLVRALRRNSFTPTKHDAPHMSLVYGTDPVPVEPLEPIGWTATELVLLLSHQGCGHHQLVAQWPLGGR